MNNKFCGGHSTRETPSSIPNLEAKPCSGEDTPLHRVRENSTPPQINNNVVPLNQHRSRGTTGLSPATIKTWAANKKVHTTSNDRHRHQMYTWGRNVCLGQAPHTGCLTNLTPKCAAVPPPRHRPRIQKPPNPHPLQPSPHRRIETPPTTSFMMSLV